MNYSWALWDKMRAATIDKKGIDGLVEYLAHDVSTFPKGGYRMTFTENHDKNSWEGNQYSNFGDGLHACMVMASVVNGMPLVYSGQEAGLDRSLTFFDKDLIHWKDHENAGIYKKLFNLKHTSQALWNGEWGGEMVRIYNDKPDRIISFVREKNGDGVLPVINFSDQPVTVRLNSKYYTGDYIELFTGKEYKLTGDDVVTLNPWGYLVLVQNKSVSNN